MSSAVVWTTDRVDADLHALRDETKGESAVRGEMKEGFEAVDKRLDKIDDRFERIEARFDRRDERFAVRLDSFYQVLIRACVFAVGLLGVLVTLIGIQA
jgi:hypothetical protein